MEQIIHKQPPGLDPQEPAPLSDRAMSEEMARTSPEGRPADPNLRGKQIHWMLAAIPIVVLIAAVTIWLAGGSGTLAITIAGLGALMFLVSPTVWSALARANERDRADTKHTEIIHDDLIAHDRQARE